MSRLLITGGMGYLGMALLRHGLQAGYAVTATAYTRQPLPEPSQVTWLQLDIRDAAAVSAAFAALRPQSVIHTAFVQSGPDLLATTAEGAAHVARAATAVGARLVHLSSDVIFDGERSDPYTETDPPAPITDYGRAKACAEALVAAAAPGAALVRTSLIYGFAPIDKISQFTLDIADGRVAARLFTDEYRCPIYVEDLAAALIELVATPYAGVLNLAGPERLSRNAFGMLIARAWGRDPAQLPAGLSAESGQPRPRNCTLDSRRASALLRSPVRGVREVLAALGRDDPAAA